MIQSLLDLPTTYNAVELSVNGPCFVKKNIEKEKLDDTNVLAKLEHVGICRSDLKEVEGLRTIRHDFGHEIAATIIKAPLSSGLKFGDYVTLDPHIEIERTSGFAEYIIARGSNANLSKAFLKADRSISSTRLIFCEPLACASHCASNLVRYLRKPSLAGCNIAFCGAGNTAVLISLIVKHLGATITLYNRGSARISYLQAREIFERGVLQSLNAIRENIYDVVVVCSSMLDYNILHIAMSGLKPDGLLLLFGGTRKNDMLPNTNLEIDQLRREERHVKVRVENKDIWVGGTHGAKTDDFYNSLHYLTDHCTNFPVEKLITAQISLNQLPSTLMQLVASQNIGKTIVQCAQE